MLKQAGEEMKMGQILKKGFCVLQSQRTFGIIGVSSGGMLMKGYLCVRCQGLNPCVRASFRRTRLFSVGQVKSHRKIYS